MQVFRNGVIDESFSLLGRRLCCSRQNDVSIHVVVCDVLQNV